MFDIERFEKTFGSASSKRSISTNSTPKNQTKRKLKSVGSEPRKRKKPAEKEISEFSLNITIHKSQNITPKACPTPQSPFSWLSKTLDKTDQPVESPDKKNILPYLSCQLEDFDGKPTKDPISDSVKATTSEKCDKPNDFIKRLDLYDPDAYSPNIEEFSENEDIFLTSQSRFLVEETNKKIIEIYQQKPKYKPMKKVPKVGGLMEKLRSLKSKRNSKVCSFAKTSEVAEDQKKIEVIEYSTLCRRLIVKFKFVDEPPDPDHDFFHYFVISTDFISLFEKQVIYEVVFNQLATREVIKNNFVYFIKAIRASRNY